MDFMTAHQELRADPRGLLAGARVAIIVGLPYNRGDKLHDASSPPRIAQYARWRDYHKTLKQRGELVLADVHARFDTGAVGRVVVDSAPIMERALAARGGRGFIGKNTCFIDPDQGSFFLLSELLTTADLPVAVAKPVDPATRTVEGGCGTCKRCQVNCPTGALSEDYRLDANLCLSYWTIEHRGTIPEKFWPWLKQYYFGCDLCQLACPYNRGAAVAAADATLKLEPAPDLFDVATMDASGYERMFGGTPMTRAKRTGLMRNALIAMSVTSDARLPKAMAIAAMMEPDGVVAETLEQIRRFDGQS